MDIIVQWIIGFVVGGVIGGCIVTYCYCRRRFNAKFKDCGESNNHTSLQVVDDKYLDDYFKKLQHNRWLSTKELDNLIKKNQK